MGTNHVTLVGKFNKNYFNRYWIFWSNFHICVFLIWEKYFFCIHSSLFSSYEILIRRKELSIPTALKIWNLYANTLLFHSQKFKECVFDWTSRGYSHFNYNRSQYINCSQLFKALFSFILNWFQLTSWLCQRNRNHRFFVFILILILDRKKHKVIWIHCLLFVSSLNEKQSYVHRVSCAIIIFEINIEWAAYMYTMLYGMPWQRDMCLFKNTNKPKQSFSPNKNWIHHIS